MDYNHARYMDDLDWLMSDEGIQKITSRFDVGETVEFFVDDEWVPATVTKTNVLHVDKHRSSERIFVDDLFIEVVSNKQTNTVLQTSKRLALTGTHIRENNKHYNTMIDMMEKEPPDIKRKRQARVSRMIAGIQALEKKIRYINPLLDTRFARRIVGKYLKDTQGKNITDSKTTFKQYTLF